MAWSSQAVAVSGEQGDRVTLQRCQSVAGAADRADVALMPQGGVVYLSGHPDKSPLIEATGKSLTKLLEIADQLQLERSQVVQVKVFVDSAASAEKVAAEVKRFFPGQSTPPLVFVEWISSARQNPL